MFIINFNSNGFTFIILLILRFYAFYLFIFIIVNIFLQKFTAYNKCQRFLNF